MDPATIFALISKGLSIIPVLIEAGASAYTTISNLKKLSDAGATGTSITDEELTTIEAQFDADLADFNTPMT